MEIYHRQRVWMEQNKDEILTTLVTKQKQFFSDVLFLMMPTEHEEVATLFCCA